ncbi:hypothetical protein THIOM_000153 [Candidatus Thiomargarita nelsonii]|uniref:Uncharacterized protein n=1 Tax=Candidatus Thiomargarita nelsonii TaxID=1003181 RepID=A0A176S7K7_9GAMM|nr:hypothetical protein THIOM_000153 [Candidatus Thiomargarita nelsonii]
MAVPLTSVMPYTLRKRLLEAAILDHNAIPSAVVISPPTISKRKGVSCKVVWLVTHS